MKSFHDHLLRFAVSRRARVALLLAVALAWSSSGRCGPIHVAAKDGDTKQVEALLKAQPDLVSSKDEKFGQTPLHIAAFNDRLEVAKLLVANHADVNAKANNGSTPLHLAAAKGNADLVEFLIANKADVNALDKDGWSPAHSAVTWGHKEIAELLAKSGGKEVPAPPAPPPSAEKSGPKEIGKDGAFVAYDDGTVVDTRTNLMWAARDSGSSLSWPGAKTFAANNRTGTYSDWRLPTPEELAGIFDKAKNRKSYCQGAVDELGQLQDEIHLTEQIHLSCTRVWTSQESSDKPGSITVYDFHFGKDVARPGAENFNDVASRVLLVRDVKK
jgi:hypothetical protein